MLSSSSSSVSKQIDFEHDCLAELSKRCAFCETGFRFLSCDSFEFKNDFQHADGQFDETSNELFQHLQDAYEKSIEVLEGLI
jgi:hypothetical protein